MSTINGTNGNDTLPGTSSSDVINGLDGDDKIYGEGGNDTLTGGAGADTFFYDARQFGNDVITDFVPGTDKIDVSSLNVPNLAALTPFMSQSGPNVVITLGYNFGAESITIDNTTIAQLAASSFVFDTSTTPLNITGPSGASVLFGGLGDDTISGGGNSDTLVGGPGADTLYGNGGNDTLTGGDGADTFIYATRSFGNDVITDFLPGTDKIDLSTLDVPDLASLTPFMNQAGANVVITLGYNFGAESITIDNMTIAKLTASSFVFDTSTTPLNITGPSGASVLFGGLGDDTISGGGNSDTLVGGPGADTLYGNGGNDTLTGGDGADTFIYATRSFGNDVITDFLPGTDKIDLSTLGVPDLASLTPFMNQAGANVVITLGYNFGAESITIDNTTIAKLTASSFVFDTSTTPLNITGPSGASVLFGGLGDDTISGGGNSDTLVGGAGNDIFYGNGGNDTIIGGAGRDVAVYNLNSTAATLTHNTNGTWTIASSSTGADTLTGVEVARFNDRDISLIAQSPSTHDFNGDSVDDVLLETTAGLIATGQIGPNGQMAYQTVGALGSDWTFVGGDDFYGDGQSEYLIRNVNGAVVLGRVVGDSSTYATIAALGSDWVMRETGDFLGDGKADFLMQNTNGAVVVGEVGSSGQAAYTLVSALGTDWTFVGAGDFLGHGKSDVLVKNADGAVVVGEVGTNGQMAYTVVTALGPEWNFVGSGDFVGDGRSDFLIENNSGVVLLGEVKSGQAAYQQIAGLGPEWTFVGTSDYTGVGRDSILIQNANGSLYTGTLQSGQIQYAQVGSLSSDWHFRG